MSSLVQARPPSMLSAQRSNDHRVSLMAAARAAVLVVPAGIIVLTAFRGPMAGLLVVGALVAIALAARFPEYGLVLGAFASLAGGSFGSFTSAGGLVLIGCAALSGAALITRRTAVPWRRLLLPGLILAWLGLRVGLEGDADVLADVIRCTAALVIVLDCMQRGRNLVHAFAVAGAFFVVASTVLGVYDPTGTRFEGISGNPNRMAFGLLLLLPFLCVLVLRGKLLIRVAALAVLAAAVTLVLRSGSFQGLAGLVVLTLVVMFCWAARWPAWVRVVAFCVSLSAVVLLVGPALRSVSTSADLVTLSGRTPIYAAAIDEIMQNPFVGSGRQHFSSGGVFDRSAHSVILALAATGGLVLGLAWVAVLVIFAVRAVRMARAGNLLAAIPAVFIVEQFVQTVHLVPYAWAVVAMLLLMRRPEDLYGKAWPEQETDRTPRRGTPAPARSGLVRRSRLGRIPTTHPTPPSGSHHRKDLR